MGDFPSVQGVPAARLLCRQWQWVQDLGFGLLSCASPLCRGFHPISWWGGVFWVTCFSWLSPPTAEVCWEFQRGCLPSRGEETAALWRCPRGRRGREGPGDGIAFLLLPWPGKEATSRVSTGPWEGVQTCVSSCTWVCEQAFLCPGLVLLPPKSPRCFLPGDLCRSFPCASPSSPLPSHPAFPSASRMAASSPCSFDLSKPVPVPSCPPHAG